jgi:hypothetical protein
MQAKGNLVFSNRFVRNESYATIKSMEALAAPALLTGDRRSSTQMYGGFSVRASKAVSLAATLDVGPPVAGSSGRHPL